MAIGNKPRIAQIRTAYPPSAKNIWVIKMVVMKNFQSCTSKDCQYIESGIKICVLSSSVVDFCRNRRLKYAKFLEKN